MQERGVSSLSLFKKSTQCKKARWGEMHEITCSVSCLTTQSILPLLLHPPLSAYEQHIQHHLHCKKITNEKHTPPYITLGLAKTVYIHRIRP